MRRRKLVSFAGIKFHEDLFNHFPGCDTPTVKADGQTLEGVLSQHFFANTAKTSKILYKGNPYSKGHVKKHEGSIRQTV